jgi:hypothetical protein
MTRRRRKRRRMINKFSPSEKDKIIILLVLGCVFASITAFSLGCATGFSLAKTVRIEVGLHD